MTSNKTLLSANRGSFLKKMPNLSETADMGFEREQIIVVPVKDEAAYTVFKNAVQNHPEVVNIAGSRNHLGTSWRRVEIESGDAKSEVSLFRIGENYFETMDMKLSKNKRSPESPTSFLYFSSSRDGPLILRPLALASRIGGHQYKQKIHGKPKRKSNDRPTSIAQNLFKLSTMALSILSVWGQSKRTISICNSRWFS